MSRFHVEIPLRWADLDAYRHVNHARTVTLLEEARVELVFHRAADDGAGDWSDGLLVASLQVDYKVQIPYQGQSVRVSMWTDQVRAASFLIHYELRTGPAESDPVAATARTQMVPYDLGAGRPRRLTDAERLFLARWADGPGPEETEPSAPGNRATDGSAAEPGSDTAAGSVDRSMGARRAAAALRPLGPE
ncbi:MAG: acyl-CoA thioester hydrolase [Pseudonocardiales bacterium]|nr:acyl-CoA thioester hydrolase [Pseudonocardiales bacterium]